MYKIAWSALDRIPGLTESLPVARVFSASTVPSTMSSPLPTGSSMTLFSGKSPLRLRTMVVLPVPLLPRSKTPCTAGLRTATSRASFATSWLTRAVKGKIVDPDSESLSVMAGL